jgi:hypothetical protein
MEQKNCPAKKEIETTQKPAGFLRKLSDMVVRTLEECGSIEQRIEMRKSKF